MFCELSLPGATQQVSTQRNRIISIYTLISTGERKDGLVGLKETCPGGRLVVSPESRWSTQTTTIRTCFIARPAGHSMIRWTWVKSARIKADSFPLVASGQRFVCKGTSPPNPLLDGSRSILRCVCHSKVQYSVCAAINLESGPFLREEAACFSLSHGL
ncbi:hypothetical protein M427DRAFT_238161 [Gonapodya prolifera JEL478]|uniref:Uncharacterized protein n=1 Tax=Gonapodya prolifera (strain JEL478) TaxID=1344416 RepID=A0A139AMS1_GONPJ|nr:hypothetical protein M427DRAFT_238161 [Gonapodya prolifera JEL478]|eukprot:KXS18049.1 hypothetical protein M427DRAFT_238161 [Gonapodya prolifera JEL478]